MVEAHAVPRGEGAPHVTPHQPPFDPLDLLLVGPIQLLLAGRKKVLRVGESCRAPAAKQGVSLPLPEREHSSSALSAFTQPFVGSGRWHVRLGVNSTVPPTLLCKDMGPKLQDSRQDLISLKVRDLVNGEEFVSAHSRDGQMQNSPKHAGA